jgi:glutaredoxin
MARMLPAVTRLLFGAPVTGLCLLSPATGLRTVVVSVHGGPAENQEMTMKQHVVFYHAGCPVCVAAEQQVAAALDPARYAVEIVHLGEQGNRVAEAEAAGVQSVPALVLDGTPFHINFGADLAVLK